SSCMGMELVLMSILDPGDEVLIFSPYFTPYKQQIELAWGKAVEVPTYEEDGFAIRAQALRAALTPKTKAIILNNPCNPTGAACSMETYRLIADIAQQRDLVVIADEIYTSYMYTEKFVPLRALDGMAERTITLNSFSKNYMMTGWRIGYVVAEPVFTSTMKKINENMVYTAPSISQRAAIYALRLREEMKEHYITEYKKRVYYASDRINSIPKLSVRRPDGTFYLFMNIKKTGLSSAEFCSRLLEQAHVVMIPGNAFGSAGEGYVRIACTTGIAQLKTAFDRIEKMTF
ncbi:MAG: aminotransferase class I/II-fold pyridoxal phosphate-dependent enzyme, partial [Pygmaiobacter sp.]